MLVLPVGIPDFAVEIAPVYRRISKRKIAIDLPDGAGAHYAEVFTLSGQKLLREQLKSENHFELELPETSSGHGVYLIVIPHSQGSWTHKIVL